MFFYLLYHGQFKNHPILLQLVPHNTELRALLGAIILYFVSYAILFTQLFDFSLTHFTKHFWTMFFIDMFLTGTIVYQNDNFNMNALNFSSSVNNANNLNHNTHHNSNMNTNTFDEKINSILKKNDTRNQLDKSRKVHFDFNPVDDETSIESGDSDFDLNEFEKSL